MTKVFIANFYTQGMLEADIDDYDHILEVEASPQFAYISTTMQGALVPAERDMVEEITYFDDETVSERQLKLEELDVETIGWTVPEQGRPNQVFAYRLGGPLGELMAMLVVQEVELV